MNYYILKNKEIIVPASMEEFHDWMESSFTDINHERYIKRTVVNGKWVSTVFLGLDHNWSMMGPPVLFETMIFPEVEYCIRASTYSEALVDHDEAVEFLKKGGGNDGNEKVSEENEEIKRD